MNWRREEKNSVGNVLCFERNRSKSGRWKRARKLNTKGNKSFTRRRKECGEQSQKSVLINSRRQHKQCKLSTNLSGDFTVKLQTSFNFNGRQINQHSLRPPHNRTVWMIVRLINILSPKKVWRTLDRSTLTNKLREKLEAFERGNWNDTNTWTLETLE